MLLIRITTSTVVCYVNCNHCVIERLEIDLSNIFFEPILEAEVSIKPCSKFAILTV